MSSRFSTLQNRDVRPQRPPEPAHLSGATLERLPRVATETKDSSCFRRSMGREL